MSRRREKQGNRDLKKWMTIGELGRHSGVGVETVRYYQRLGLIRVPATRGHRSHRKYGADAVAELAFVRRCKALGFRLKEIGALVQMRRAPGGSCDGVHQRLAELRSHLVAKQQQVEAQLTAVQSLLDACGGGVPVARCQAMAHLVRAGLVAARQ